jgi:aspartate carbamoyltransferase catalytic subunit
MRKDVIEDTRGKVDYMETESLRDVVGDLDVLYMTRIQRERFPSDEEYNKYSGAYIIDREFMRHAKPDMTLLHPLPRVNEIEPEVDGLPNAWYFKQVHHGVYARMAIIGLALGLL